VLVYGEGEDPFGECEGIRETVLLRVWSPCTEVYKGWLGLYAKCEQGFWG